MQESNELIKRSEITGQFPKPKAEETEIIKLNPNPKKKTLKSRKQDIVLENPEIPGNLEIGEIGEKVKKPRKPRIKISKEPIKDTSEKDIKNAKLVKEFGKFNCNEPSNINDTECNKFLLKKELMEKEELRIAPETNDYLYPTLNDPNFVIKIAEKKEFHDTQYNGEVYDVKKQAELLSKMDFELSPHQAFVRNFLSSQTPYNSLLLYHGLGSGKCHKINTPIMMSDGSVKMVQDIHEGEFLMGDDSSPRKVLSLARGVDKMYDIIPVKGDTYTVNQEHILCLKASGFPKLCANNHKANTNYNIQWIENNKFQSKTFTFQPSNEEQKILMRNQAEEFFKEIQQSKNTNKNILEISVKDYLKLSKSIKANLKGYKVPIEFAEVELPMDPYMIGYWLGDGSSNGCDITCQDSTVLYYFAKTLQTYNLNFMYRSQYTYGISGTGRYNNNVFLNALKGQKLINNKHIPTIYKCNTRENRLKLLAGLIDSDGSLSDNGIEFTQKNEKLMDDVIFLARSLGFSCYKHEKKTSWTYKGIKNYGTAFRICINGAGIEEIPTKIPRKQANPRLQIKDVLVSGITVEYVNEDDYYGFTLDGNCRYLLGDFTVTHNTLSSIGVCEEMRDYNKQMGISKKIMIVASPNVQDNFRNQLFDDRKLKLVDGLWNIRDATGNKLLKEINPMNMKGLTKEKIISQIKGLINQYYSFYGYVEFANYIERTKTADIFGKKTWKKIGLEEGREKRMENLEKKKAEREEMMEYKKLNTSLDPHIIRNLKYEFENRLIVIDEVHNIRITEDNENKNVAEQLMDLVKSVQKLRLLFLSATPMYNSYKEIIWLLNLMNINDQRSTIRISDVFDNDGNFKKNTKGEEVGKELFIHKATGYISFVRGENPYTFPFRVYPDIFSPDNTFQSKVYAYPRYQMNGKTILEKDRLKILHMYLNKIGSVQSLVYRYIIDSLRKQSFSITTKKGVVKEMPNFDNMESFGYTLLLLPIESLIIGYPIDHLEDAVNAIVPVDKIKSTEKKATKKLLIQPEPLALKPLEGKPLEPVVVEEQKIEITRKASSEPSIESYSYEAETTKKGGRGSNGVRESNGGDTPSPIEERRVFINSNDLTGTAGMNRMMDFVDSKRDKTNPQEKGSFAYKKKTLDTYGKIFSPSEIGKYSSKIKSVCENIYTKEHKVAEGIILIYSQYIDGGLIPMALALEEMGFTRHGQNAKSLFKQPPTAPVDVRTMEPRKTGDTDFKPAKYILISGDPRISPNNDFEIKSVTGDDNKDGFKVKVVLISKAGSEGLDFKFLRQVHILEPWYTLNRLEQITGRAVRNFSHKDLEFEKRNVEIFLHGTILEENKEEAADLYVYRVAEYKAIQSGKVSRVLKETAVDCILNHDQTNFTQENMAKINQNGVTQVLSNGMTVEHFKVGDAPFSATCDYMENCEFKCTPDKHIEEKDTRQDTYNESFIMLNSEKIFKKIRELMKERFFYKKKELIFRLQTPKPYPLVQIYAALTQMIEDTNEFIVDKYGRTGYLINIGDYYLFQPSELNNPNISIFERSVPIDYKHSMIEMDVKKNIGEQSIVEERNLEEQSAIEEQPSAVEEQSAEEEQQSAIKEQPEVTKKTGTPSDIMREIKEQYDLAMHFASSPDKIPKGDDNWYKHCGITMKKMVKDGIPILDVTVFLVEHIVDFLMFKEKWELLNELYSLDTLKEGSLEDKIKHYLDSKMIKTKRLIGIILASGHDEKILILKGNKWTPAEPEDKREIAAEASKTLSIKGKFSPLVGFIALEQKSRFLVFKIKQTNEKRNTGARCDEASKSKKIQFLNEMYDKINGSDKFVDRLVEEDEMRMGFVSIKGLGQTELCSLLEFMLRYYNKTRKNDKIWFLTYELSTIYKF